MKRLRIIELIYLPIIIGILIVSCSAPPAPVQSTEFPLPSVTLTIRPTNTETPLPTTTPTTEPTKTPTSTPIPVPGVIAELLDNVEITYSDSTFKNDQWGWIEEGFMGVSDGVISMKGIEFWASSITRNHNFSEKTGFIIDFKFSKGSDFEIFVDQIGSSWWTDGYKRFGVYPGPRSYTDVWVGTKGFGNKLTNNLSLKPDTWYSFLMVIGEKGEFLAYIWNPANPGPRQIYHDKVREDWGGLSWQFVSGLNKGVIDYSNYREIKYSSIK